MTKPIIPKTCPHCGAGEENFAGDYFEAVWQGNEVVRFGVFKMAGA